MQSFLVIYHGISYSSLVFSLLHTRLKAGLYTKEILVTLRYATNKNAQEPTLGKQSLSSIVVDLWQDLPTFPGKMKAFFLKLNPVSKLCQRLPLYVLIFSLSF